MPTSVNLDDWLTRLNHLRLTRLSLSRDEQRHDVAPERPSIAGRACFTITFRTSGSEIKIQLTSHLTSSGEGSLRACSALDDGAARWRKPGREMCFRLFWGSLLLARFYGRSVWRVLDFNGVLAECKLRACERKGVRLAFLKSGLAPSGRSATHSYFQG
jgi:hypothetical protein